jgi:ribonucleoside-triphosphate reductase
MNLINKAFLEVMSEGDAKGRIFTFPIPTYNITKDFDWDNEIMQVLWEATGKYGFAYFANFINADMKPEDARSMCCRLRIDNRELNRRGGSLFGASPLTGSIGVVTLNMPRLGYLAKTEEDFIERLDKLLILARNSLEIKRKVLERLSDENLYPYAKYYLRNIKTRFDRYWKNHFSTIGLVGMNEACINLFKKDIGQPEGNAFAQRVLDHIRQRITEFQTETGNLYNLEATPAESTSYRLARLDKKKYPDMIFANEKDVQEGAEPFYTNSTNLPVDYTDDVFEVLELQKGIQTKYTGGTVLHIFLGERIGDPASVKNLVKKICSNYEIPYFTITPTFSICPKCGYLAGEHAFCPHCHSECEIYSRIVGYFRSIQQWNNGKKEEYKLRKTFNIKYA